MKNWLAKTVASQFMQDLHNCIAPAIFFLPSLADKRLSVQNEEKLTYITMLFCVNSLNPPKWHINFRSPLLGRVSSLLSFHRGDFQSHRVRHVPDFPFLSLSLRYFRNQARSRNLTRQAQYDIALGKATALYGHVITAREWRGTVSRTVREAKGGTEPESERERQWIDEEKEADDDDGCKGGCPSSFSSVVAANPSGDSARQLSTDCRSLPLEEPRGRNSTRNDSWGRSVPRSVAWSTISLFPNW